MTKLKVELPAHLKFVQQLDCSIRHNLSNSSAHALTIAQLCQLAGEDFSRFADMPLSYASLKGDETLRALIAQFHQQLNCHQTLMSAEHVLTFCGAQEAIAAIYQLVLEPQDEVVVVTPNYPSLIEMARKKGCKVNAIALCSSNDWQLTIDDFKQCINANTKLIVLNSPHNPTGQIIDSDLANDILQLAKQYNCYIISDDVAQASNYHELPLAHSFLDYEKTFVISVMSKSLGLAGVRIGWVVSQNVSLLNSLLAIKSYGSICCSAVDEQLAIMALTHASTIINNNNALIASNIDYFNCFVDQFDDRFAWTPPKAGILALVEVKVEQPVMSWATALAKRYQLLALPSELFGLSGSYFRLGLGQRSFQQSIDTLKNALETL